MNMLKNIKNFFQKVIKKFNFKFLQIKKEESLTHVQEQLYEASVIKRLKKKNVKSRKDI